MNGLEALEEIKCDMEYVTRLDYVEPIVRGEVRDKLKKIYWRELDQLDRIEQELKAFEIIKKSISDVTSLDLLLRELLLQGKINQDEFDLLKEVLK